MVTRNKKITKCLAGMLSLIWLLQPGVVPYSLNATEPNHLSVSSSFMQGWRSLLDSDLNSLLDSARGLAFSQQPDAIDSLLRAYSKRNAKPYLRVTVHDPEDLSALRVAVRLEKGKLVQKTSALKKLLYETGGILYLDYANSDPKLVEEFNSLFDQTPRFEGKGVSDELLVVGVMDRQLFARYPVSFYSRYRKIIHKELKEEDPLKQVTAPPKNYVGEKINLHFSSQYESILVGKYFFDAKGELQFGTGDVEFKPEGVLVQAMREGKPLLLENAPWENKKLSHFIRQLLIEQGVRVNGDFVSIQSGFQLYRRDVDEAKEANAATHVTPNSDKEVLILNRETLDSFYTLVHIADKKMKQLPGWIQTDGKQIAVRVTEPLPDEVWHQLFHAPRPLEIQVLNPEWVPLCYRDKIKKGFEQIQKLNEPISWEEWPQHQGVYLQAADLNLLSEKIKSRLKETVHVFPITPETMISELTGSLEVSGSGESAVGHDFEFRVPKNGVIEALQRGDAVILEGIDRNPTLLKQLQSLLISKPYWVVNGQKIFLKTYPGRLILTGKTKLPPEFWGACYWQQSQAEADQEKKNFSASLDEKNWEKQKEKALWVLEKYKMVFLKGEPGVGKSYVSDELAQELGYQENEIYPLVTGANTRLSDVLSRHHYDEKTRTSGPLPQVIEKWARNPNGGLLLWDEANLVPSDFSQFLSGVTAPEPFIWINGEKINLTPRHRVLFTGNPETFQGRVVQNLIEEKVITLNFYPFSDAELKELIVKNRYLSPEKNVEETVDLMIELHRFFEKVRPYMGFSLRDIQELATRIEILIPDSRWDKSKIIQIAWDLYSGYFDREEEVMAKAFLQQKYGVTLGVINDTLFASAAFGQGIGWTQESSLLVRRLQDFLKVRQVRIQSQSKTKYRGKWALLFEGPSGVGKDDLTEKTLQAHGLKAGDDYFVWNASPHKIEELKNLIERAAKEGKIILLSEINLVSSAILEGMLNTLLTEQGHFQPGFALIGTMNSVNFQGRETFSSAFKNRMVYYRVYDYAQKGLRQIARSFFSDEEWSKHQEAAQTMIGVHTWIRDQVAGPHQSPTLRELIRALKQIKENKKSAEIVNEVYQPIYLENILTGKKLPPLEQLAHYQEKESIDWAKAYQLGAQFFLGKERAEKIKFAQKIQNKRPLPEKIGVNQIEISEKGSLKAWQELMEAVGGHLFHEKKSPWKPSAETKPLYLLLENYRILVSLKKAKLIEKIELYDGETNFLRAIEANDYPYLESLSDQELFGSMLILGALGKLKNEAKSYVAEVLEKEEVMAAVQNAIPTAKNYLKETQQDAFKKFKKLKGVWKNFSKEKPNSFALRKPLLPQKEIANKETTQEKMARLKEERRDAKIKELKEKIEMAEKKLEQHLYNLSKYEFNAIQQQFRMWKEESQQYRLRNKTRLEKLGKRVAAVAKAKKMDQEIEQIAEKAAFDVGEETLKKLFAKIKEMLPQIKQLKKNKKLSDSEQHSLLRKWNALLSGLEQLKNRELLEKNSKYGLAGKAYAEQYFGKDFFKELDPKGSKGLTGKEGTSSNKDYNTDYEEGENIVYQNVQYFEPHLFRYVRLNVKKLDYQQGKVIAKEREDQNLIPVSFEGGTQAEWESKNCVVFQAKIPLTFTQGETKPIPSVAPEQHFFNQALPEGISLYKDSLGLYYAQSNQDYSEPVDLKFSVAVPKSYFGIKVLDSLTIAPDQKIARQALNADLVFALQQFGLEPEETHIKKILTVLASTLKSFESTPIPEEKRSENQFFDLISHRAGAACRHRARIFVILAQALGLEVRMATSIPHAFPEVYLPPQGGFEGGWMQIRDIGGAPGEIRNEMPEFNLKERFSFSKPEKIETKERKAARKESLSLPEETVQRDSFIQQITEEKRNKVKEIVRDLFYEALASEQQQQASEQGSHFSVTRFIEDPSRPFITALPHLQLFPKQILLTSPFEKWNPLLEELLFFLFDEGIEMFVYEGNEYEPSLARTLSELKECLKTAPQVSAEEVKQFIHRERNPLTTVALDLNQFLNQAKHPYLADLFYQSLVKKETPENSKKMPSFQWFEELVVDGKLPLKEEPRVTTKRKKEEPYVIKGEWLFDFSSQKGFFIGSHEVIAVDIDEGNGRAEILLRNKTVLREFSLRTFSFSPDSEKKNACLEGGFTFDEKEMIDILETLVSDKTTEIKIRVIQGELILASLPKDYSYEDGLYGSFVDVFKFDLKSFKLISKEKFEAGYIGAIGLSPDGKYLAIAYEEEFCFYYLQNLASSTLSFSTPSLEGRPTAIWFDAKNNEMHIETEEENDLSPIDFKGLSEENIYAKIEERISNEAMEEYWSLVDGISSSEERKECLIQSYTEAMSEKTKRVYTWKAPAKNEPQAKPQFEPGTFDWLLSEAWRTKQLEPVELEEDVHPLEREPISADGTLRLKFNTVKKGSNLIPVLDVLDLNKKVISSWRGLDSLEEIIKVAATNNGKLFAHATDTEISFLFSLDKSMYLGRGKNFIPSLPDHKILDFVLDPLGRYVIYLIKNDETKKIFLVGNLLSQDERGNLVVGEAVELLDSSIFVGNTSIYVLGSLSVSSDGDFLFLNRQSGWEARMIDFNAAGPYLKEPIFEEFKYLFALPNGIGLVAMDSIHLYERTEEPGSLLPSRKINLCSDHLLNRVDNVVVSPDQKIVVIACGGILDFVSLTETEIEQPFLSYAFDAQIENVSFEPDGSQINVYLKGNKILRFSRDQVEPRPASPRANASFLFDIATAEEIRAAVEQEITRHPSKKEKMNRSLAALKEFESEAKFKEFQEIAAESLQAVLSEATKSVKGKLTKKKLAEAFINNKNLQEKLKEKIKSAAYSCSIVENAL